VQNAREVANVGWVNEGARIVLSIFFIFHGVNHFVNLKSLSELAKKKGIPYPQAAVVVSGAALLAGGLSLLFSYQVVIGSLAAAAFLVIAAAAIHRFWDESDSAKKANEMAHFLKNLAVAAATVLAAAGAS